MSVDVVVSEKDLADVLEQVWAAYLDPEGACPLLSAGGERPESEVHASVSITGSWTGHVVYGSSSVAARMAAAKFMAVEPDEVTDADISDVLGELANIVGGNVKAMLPPGAALSLPQVVLAPDSATIYPNANRVSGMHGRWDGEPVSISMWQSRDDLKEGKTA